MAQFSVNPQRADLYKHFKFRIKWDDRYVAGVSKIDALSHTTDPVEYREGGDPSTLRKSPGPTKYSAVTLERGVTRDTEFGKWANRVWDRESGPGADTVEGSCGNRVKIGRRNQGNPLLRGLIYRLRFQ